MIDFYDFSLVGVRKGPYEIGVFLTTLIFFRKNEIIYIYDPRLGLIGLKHFSIDVFLLINNLIEKKMIRRATFNLAVSYIVRFTFSDLKCNLSEIKDNFVKRC